MLNAYFCCVINFLFSRANFLNYPHISRLRIMPRATTKYEQCIYYFYCRWSLCFFFTFFSVFALKSQLYVHFSSLFFSRNKNISQSRAHQKKNSLRTHFGVINYLSKRILSFSLFFPQHLKWHKHLKLRLTKNEP